MEHYPLTESVKIENLLKMADYIEKIPENKFTMSCYRGRLWDLDNHECRSYGCIVGHCIVLDDFSKLPIMTLTGGIDHTEWSSVFTGLSACSSEWSYLFSNKWEKVDNTTKGAAKRIRYFVKNGLPANWRAQLYGSQPLSYNQ